MKRLLVLVLCALTLLSAAPAGMASEYVFDGIPDYQYQSDEMNIGIKRIQENEVTYFLADVRIHDVEHLQSALSGKYAGLKNGKKTETTSAIAERNNAVLAINADNFKSHGYGVIIRNGDVMRQKDTTRHLMAITGTGDLEVFNERPKPAELVKQLVAEGVENTFEFGPVLVQNGQAAQLNKSFKLIATRDSILEPRTAIGQLGELHYLIIVVDGRKEGYSKGMNLSGLQSLFLRYGAKNAFNLDGGGSTTLYFKGEVINQPSGGRQRAVSDILMIR